MVRWKMMRLYLLRAKIVGQDAAERDCGRIGSTKSPSVKIILLTPKKTKYGDLMPPFFMVCQYSTPMNKAHTMNAWSNMTKISRSC